MKRSQRARARTRKWLPTKAPKRRPIEYHSLEPQQKKDLDDASDAFREAIARIFPGLDMQISISVNYPPGHKPS